MDPHQMSARTISEMTQDDCTAVLVRASFGRVACSLNDQHLCSEGSARDIPHSGILGTFVGCACEEGNTVHGDADTRQVPEGSARGG